MGLARRVIQLATSCAGRTRRAGDALFGAFYRSEEVAGIAGLGIGLSVCKRFAEAEGGFMSARPREGGGAEFALTLPAAPGIALPGAPSESGIA